MTLEFYQCFLNYYNESFIDVVKLINSSYPEIELHRKFIKMLDYIQTLIIFKNKLLLPSLVAILFDDPIDLTLASDLFSQDGYSVILRI